MRNITILLFVICNGVVAQENQVSLGILSNIGSVSSLSGKYESRDERYNLASLGVYSQLRLTKDSTKTVQFLRIDFGFEGKKGTFSNGTIEAQVRSDFYYLNFLTPFLFDIGKQHSGYAGVGLNLGYRLIKEVTPEPYSSDFSSQPFAFSLAPEFGVLLGNASMIGFRMSTQIGGELRYSSWSFVFGVSPQIPKKKK